MFKTPRIIELEYRWVDLRVYIGMIYILFLFSYQFNVLIVDWMCVCVAERTRRKAMAPLKKDKVEKLKADLAAAN